MTEFEPWDRIRHTYTAYTGQEFVREGNITTITEDFGIGYTTGTATFFAQVENIELISRRTRKRVKPSKREKELRAKLREIESYIRPLANDVVSIYEDDWYERGFERGQINLAKELLEIITEGKR